LSRKLSLSLLVATAALLLAAPSQAVLPSPPAPVKSALLANGYVMFKAASNGRGGFNYSAGRAGGGGIVYLRVALARRSPSDARAYGAAVGREPARTQYAALAARDAGASSARILRIRVIGSYTILDFRMKA
jgi:hypothetical protein